MNVKQVIVLRKDLTMRKGKIIAQGAHASLQVILDFMQKKTETEYILNVNNNKALATWLNGGSAKVCLYVESENELIEIFEKAQAQNLPAALITDSGKTEFAGIATKTCLAIGPAENEKIDSITGHLKLL